jgi:hypothetical protein
MAIASIRSDWAGTTSGSRAAEEQHQAGAAVLGMLLARSLVVLADAQQQAAEAAGTSPAQLFAR